MQVKKFRNASSYCPSSWIGVTDNNEGVYIRYRNNVLKVIVGNPPMETHGNSRMVVERKLDGKRDNRLSLDELREALENSNIGVPDQTVLKDDDIEDVKNSMSEYLKDVESLELR
jgi:hypothetical protein